MFHRFLVMRKEFLDNLLTRRGIWIFIDCQYPT
jgi:hypothetical protein